MANFVKEISSVIRSIKRNKGDGGVISARPVKRLSVQQREHHTIDSTKLARILWTPAIQAGLVKKQLNFWEIFTALEIIFWWLFMFLRTRVRAEKFTWIFAAIEVCSRLWISKIVGKRNYRNIKILLNQAIDAFRIVNPFIFTTDGFEPYSWAAKNILDSICLYAQVIKKRRKNRVIKVERRLIIGTKSKMEQLLFESEDSSTINTSFIERLNLTI